MYKYIIKFEKADSVKYVSHLDLVRVFGRTMRRAGLPISYSQGFNPHPLITFAHPLSIGISSVGEMAELVLDDRIQPEELKKRLNDAFPNGLTVTAVKINEEKNNFGKITLADYMIKLYFDEKPPYGFLDSFFAQNEIMCMRKTKSKNENTDIKPYISSFEHIDTTDNTVRFFARIKTGAENLKPSLLASAIAEYARVGLVGQDICRMTLLDKDGVGI